MESRVVLAFLSPAGAQAAENSAMAKLADNERVTPLGFIRSLREADDTLPNNLMSDLLRPNTRGCRLRGESQGTDTAIHTGVDSGHRHLWLQADTGEDPLQQDR